MNYYDSGKAFRYLVEYLEENSGKRDLTKFLKIINESLVVSSSTSNDEFDEKICNLIEEIEKEKNDEVIIILKNKNNYFDIYIFEEEVSFSVINLVSSEIFLDTLRRNPIDGYVIENISDDDILVFLKSYYIYRKSPQMSSTALNMVNQYNYECLELAAINDKFKGDNLERKVDLKSIILYDKDALPHYLEYLNDYHEEIEALRARNKSYSLKNVMHNVRNNRFLGMSLKKY